MTATEEASHVSTQSIREGNLWTARLIGAAALLVMAAVHLQQLLGDGFTHVSTIGPLFWLNAATGVVLSAGVVLWRSWIPALAGVAVAGGALTALYLSEHGGIFGYVEAGYRPAIVIAIASEAVAVVALGAAAALVLLSSRSPSTPRGGLAGPQTSVR